MAKRLIFDRSLAIFAKIDDVVTVPDGEVWKATLCNNGTIGEANELQHSNFRTNTSDELYYPIMGAGTKIRCKYHSFITGIAFKVVEE